MTAEGVPPVPAIAPTRLFPLCSTSQVSGTSAPSASTGFAAKSPVKAAITLNNDAIRPLAPGTGIRVGSIDPGMAEIRALTTASDGTVFAAAPCLKPSRYAS